MAKEGLAYCIARRTKGPKVPGPGEQEILNDFLKFCLDGVRGENGDHITDEDTGGQVAGTINWLASLGKFKANFYVAHEPALMFFVSLPEGSEDWRDNPGFMFFVRIVDLTLDLHSNSGQFKRTGKFILEPQTDLDDALAAMEHRIAAVSKKNRPRLIAALSGKKGTNLNQVIDDVDREESMGLRDFFDERQKAFERQLAAQAQSRKKSKR